MGNILTAQQVQQLRSQTRGTAGKIHFNNAGASLPPDVVVDTVVNYLQQEAVTGGYELEYALRDELDNTYTLIARLINAGKDEIALVENASAGWWTAFNGIDFAPGDEIIASEYEYVTNIAGFIHAQQKLGVKVKVAPLDEQGNINLQSLEEAITPKTKLIAVTHIPSATGGVLPVAHIGAIARRHGILYLVDACQSVGHIPVDVRHINCDMLCVTGRKYLRGPRGTGFLFVRRQLQNKLKITSIDGSTAQWITTTDFKLKDNAHRFELYERNRALILGLGKAVEYALAIGMDAIWQRIQYIAGYLRTQLAAIPGITLHDIGDVLSGIVTFSVDGIDSQTVKDALGEHNINVTVGKAVSTLYYMSKHGLTTIVRASVHYYNTEEEIHTLCAVLKNIAARKS